MAKATQLDSPSLIPRSASSQTLSSPTRRSGDESALHRAARAGDMESLLEILTEKSIEINTRDQFGETPLHLVAHNNRIKLADRLLRESTIEVNCTDLFGRTPLFLAARNGHVGNSIFQHYVGYV